MCTQSDTNRCIIWVKHYNNDALSYFFKQFFHCFAERCIFHKGMKINRHIIARIYTIICNVSFRKSTYKMSFNNLGNVNRPYLGNFLPKNQNQSSFKNLCSIILKLHGKLFCVFFTHFTILWKKKSANKLYSIENSSMKTFVFIIFFQ